MSGRVLSEPEVQPAEVPARVAPAGVPAGRVPATKVPASGMAASASVLRLCGNEETDYGQQDRKDARRPHKEGNSSGHGLPTPGSLGPVYSCSGRSGVCDFHQWSSLRGNSRSAMIAAQGALVMRSRQGYKGYVIEARSCELKDNGFSAEFSVEEHDASGVTETQL